MKLEVHETACINKAGALSAKKRGVCSGEHPHALRSGNVVMPFSKSYLCRRNRQHMACDRWWVYVRLEM